MCVIYNFLLLVIINTLFLFKYDYFTNDLVHQEKARCRCGRSYLSKQRLIWGLGGELAPHRILLITGSIAQSYGMAVFPDAVSGHVPGRVVPRLRPRSYESGSM